MSLFHPVIGLIIDKVSEKWECKKHFQKREPRVLSELIKDVCRSPTANTGTVSNEQVSVRNEAEEGTVGWRSCEHKAAEMGVRIPREGRRKK